MVKLERRDVVLNPTGGWNVTRPGLPGGRSHHLTQSDTEQAAKRDLRNGPEGEVVIHRPDGTIRDKDTVPPARDPFLPRDEKH
ncbi:MAG: DUF2188 domain-containing protein [Actinomycetota bacterium]